MTTLGKTSNAKLILALVAVIGAFFRLAVPFVDETSQKKSEIISLKKQNEEIKNQAQSYDSAWDKVMTEKETRMNIALPDSMNSGQVLDYFLNRFEKEHPDKIRFVSVNHQATVATDVKMGTGKNKTSPQVSKYKVKALVLQDTVVPYIEHIEKFSGTQAVESFSLAQQAKGGPLLEMEVTLALYLSPKEWVASEKRAAEFPVLEGLSKADEQNWFQIYSSQKEKGGRQVTSFSDPYETTPKFKIAQIVGKGIVVGEKIYEEGDTVHGWKILQVNGTESSVTLKRGDMTRRVSVHE